MEQPLSSSVLENIQWLKDQLEEQEDLLYLRVDYILKQIATQFGGEIESWRVLGSYDGQTIKDCIGENFVDWYFIEWKRQPRAFFIQINGKDLYFTSEFPTRWLTENFENELKELIEKSKANESGS